MLDREVEAPTPFVAIFAAGAVLKYLSLLTWQSRHHQVISQRKAPRCLASLERPHGYYLRNPRVHRCGILRLSNDSSRGEIGCRIVPKESERGELHTTSQSGESALSARYSLGSTQGPAHRNWHFFFARHCIFLKLSRTLPWLVSCDPGLNS